jgi:putative PIN family toxin of toxin-antitoxin system
MTEQKCWVFDTNTLISRLLTPGGVPAKAVDHALTNGILLVSEDTMNELARVLDRPKFDPYVSRKNRRQFISLLGGVSRLVPIARRVHACRDPNDDMFLDVALNGEAKAIITGDGDLLALDPFHGVRIVKPAEFLEWSVT